MPLHSQADRHWQSPVSGDRISMDWERLASARCARGISFLVPFIVSFHLALMIVVVMISIIAIRTAQRETHDVHFIRAFNAMSRINHAKIDGMSKTDFNLLVTLDAVLAEGSVARAARRLRLSPSAISRALARLRATTGDPLLVRAGRGLVPTPRALELREKVASLVRDVEAVLRPAETLDLKRLVRTFTLRADDSFFENFGPYLIARIGAKAPGARLRFVQKSDNDSASLRDGTVDLEIGVVGENTGREVQARTLFRDRFVGVARTGHELSRGEVTSARYAAAKHIAVRGAGSIRHRSTKP